MDVIKVSEKIFQKEPKYTGYESDLYSIDGMLLKIFKTEDLEILKNKRKKLEILSNLNIDDPKPIALIEINGKFKGYFQLEKLGYHNINIFKGSTKEKIEILKQIKLKLDLYHKNHIIFGDISLNNILTDGKNICFCDLDNMKIETYYFDVLNNCEKRYLKVLEADEFLDTYMFNLLTITYLKKIIMNYSLTYLRNNNLPFILNSKENKQIVESMIKLDQKEAIKPFIDYTKRYHLF